MVRGERRGRDERAEDEVASTPPMRVEDPQRRWQHEQQVRGAHGDRGGHRNARVAEIPVVARSLDEAIEDEREEELTGTVLPQPLATDAQTAGAERVDEADDEGPAALRHDAEGPIEDEGRERGDERGRELLETVRPDGVRLHAGQDERGVSRHGQHARPRAVRRKVAAVPVLQVVGNPIQQREGAIGVALVEIRKFREIERAVPEKSPRQVCGRQRVPRPDRAAVGQVRA